MRYEKTGRFPCHAIGNVLTVLKEAPPNYTVHVRHVDAVYPVTEISMETWDVRTVCISSVETYGEELPEYVTVGMLIEEILNLVSKERLWLSEPVLLKAAENVDTELDAQMEEPCEIAAWGISNICQDFYLIAGSCWF